MIKKYLWGTLACIGLILGLSAFTETDNQYLLDHNIILNPGFENGKVGWLDTSNTFALTSGAANSMYGNATATWTGSNTGHFLRSSPVSLSQGLIGRQCVGSFVYKYGGNVNAEIVNNNNVSLATQALSYATAPVLVSLPFVCPTTGTIQIGVRNTNGSSNSLVVDEFYLGENRSYQQSVLGNNLVVTTTGQGNLRHEWALAQGSACSTNSSCSLTGSSSGITSVTQGTNLQNFTVNFKSGTFSAAPTCMGFATQPGSNSNTGGPVIMIPGGVPSGGATSNCTVAANATTVSSFPFCFVLPATGLTPNQTFGFSIDCIGLNGINP